MRIYVLFIAWLLLASPASGKVHASKKWVGSPITLHTKRIPLGDLLRLIADASGFNIVLGDGVGGDFPSVSWDDVPWDQALDMILKTKRLHAERDGNMLRIVTNEEFVREQDEQRKSREPASF